MNYCRYPFVVALTLAVLGLGGCAHVKTASEDAVAWVRDALQTNLDAPLARTVEAAGDALKELKFTAVTAKSDAFSGEVSARTAKDDRVSVRLTALNATQTRVDIRVGTFGDKVVSQRILEELQKNL